MSDRGSVKKLEMDFISEERWNSKQVNRNLYERVDVLLTNYMFTCRNFVSISAIIFSTVIVIYLNLILSCMSCCHIFIIEFESCTYHGNMQRQSFYVPSPSREDLE